MVFAGFSTNNTDRHDIIVMLLKVPLNTIKQTKPNIYFLCIVDLRLAYKNKQTKRDKSRGIIWRALCIAIKIQLGLKDSVCVFVWLYNAIDKYSRVQGNSRQ